MSDFNDNNEVFSRRVKAGKRTYFFDVKETKAGEYYITITESKKRFNEDSGKFFFEKHKVFLYKEDYEKFRGSLDDVLDFVQKNQGYDKDFDRYDDSNEQED